MTDRHHHRVKKLFLEARDVPLEERGAWLEDACGDDATVRDDVEALLAAEDGMPSDYLDLSAGVGEYAGALLTEMTEAPSSGMVGRRVGPYRLVREIGRGGMGAVYLAERADGHFDQRVALKLLASGLDSAEHERRLRAERQILAGLDHPNVARLLDGGATSDGLPFLVMEHVEGVPFYRYCDERRLGIEQRLSLFLRVCDSVKYAHGQRIIHRDLKPANILVTADGQVKLLDFGIAKLLGPGTGTRGATLTRTGSRPMTPEYASPEQVRGDSITTASDVYQLGVLLFELLTGQRPYRVGGRSPAEAERVVCTRSPPRPSAAVRKSLLDDADPRVLARGTTAKRLEKTLHGDLDAIVLMALCKEPEHRFASVQAFGEDIERHMTGKPVWARGQARGYRTRTFIRRHRWRVGVAAAFALLLSAFAVTAARQWVGRDTSLPTIARLVHTTMEPGVEQGPSLSPDGKAVVYAGSASGNLDIYLRAVGDQAATNLTLDSNAADYQPAFSPDGEQIAFRSNRDGGGVFVMARTGEAVRRVTDRGFNPAWSPDGRELAFTTESVTLNPFGRETTSELWTVDVRTGAMRRLDAGDAAQASWAPGGRRLVYWRRFGDPSQADLWTVSASGGEPLALTNDVETDWNPVWSPDGRFVYFASDRGGSMNLWRITVDERSGRAIGEPEPLTTPAPYLANLSIAAGGRSIAYSSVQQTQNIQRARLDPLSGDVRGEPEWVTTGSRLWSSPDPSPDGQWLAFYSRFRQEDLYVVRTDGTALRQLTSDLAYDRVPRWSPAGDWIATFSNRSDTQELWVIRRDGSGLRQLTRAKSPVAYPIWSPDGTRMAVTVGRSEDGRVHIFDPNRDWNDQQPEVLPAFAGARGPFLVTSWSLDGRQLAGQAGHPSDGIVTYSLPDRAYKRLTDFGEWPAWLSDGRRLLFVAQGKTFYLLDTHTGNTQPILTVEREVIGPPRLSHDDRHIYFSRRLTEADIWVVELS